MSFVNSQYLFYIIAAITIVILSMMWQNKRYFQWIKTYWFLERTWSSRLSVFVYYVSLSLLLLSLLDLRGPEKKIKGALPDQRTIIVLDASLSMLCEDVRPNRFVKSIQLARHFAKNSAGHQISIVLFSDTQKRLLPFTDDIDLIDSRLAALENTNAVGGGSNISQAISESAGYFEADGEGENKDTTGNILVFTDAEESEGGLEANLPSNVNLAVVGVGTAKGGNIPIRWEDGSFKGYKTHKNELVVTKLDEKFIKGLGKKIKNYNYWIVNSYSLPTEEILNFFRATYNKAHNNGDMRIRPVYSHFILIPAIILFCLSVLLGRMNTFKMKILSIFFVFVSIIAPPRSFAQEEDGKAQKIKYSNELTGDLDKIKEGVSTHKETLKTAEKLLKEKDEKKASELYSEYLKNNDEEEAKFNYVTSLLKQGKLKESRSLVTELLNNSKNYELKNKLRQNMLMAVNQKQNPKQNEKDKKENKENKEKDDKKQDQNKDSKKDNKQSNNDKGQDKNQNKNQDKKQNEQQNSQPQKDKAGKNDKDQKEKDEKKDKEKDKNNNEKKNEKNEESNDDKEDKNSPKNLEEKEKQIEQKRRMTKLPGMVKQIMNDDRELQKKLMDTSTKEKGELRPVQDW